MTIYRIANWQETFENNRSKDLKKLTWVPVPNSHDSHGYAMLLSRKNGPALYGAWMVIVQVASRCDPRGTLLRRGKTPHSSASLALMTRFPEPIIKECLEACSDPEIGWIICENTNETSNPAPSCDNAALSHDTPAPERLEGKGMEGNGKNIPEEPEPPPFYNEARIVLYTLNEKTGSKFREVDANLSMIAARLKSVDGDVEGVKAMVSRQCLLWMGDPRMERFLQPATLFGPENFEKYWGARHRPAQPYSNGNAPPKPNLNAVRKDEDAFTNHRAGNFPV